jgi:hypothetical protein
MAILLVPRPDRPAGPLRFTRMLRLDLETAKTVLDPSLRVSRTDAEVGAFLHELADADDDTGSLEALCLEVLTYSISEYEGGAGKLPILLAALPRFSRLTQLALFPHTHGRSPWGTHYECPAVSREDFVEVAKRLAEASSASLRYISPNPGLYFQICRPLGGPVRLEEVTGGVARDVELFAQYPWPIIGDPEIACTRE